MLERVSADGRISQTLLSVTNIVYIDIHYEYK